MPGPGDLLGQSVAQLFGSALDQFYRSIWNGAQALMRGSFGVADEFTTFSLTDGSGGLVAGSPLASVWPTMKWIAMTVALGLFFAQLTLTAVRGGRGMFRAVTGPVQFAVAMALTVGGVGALLAATDGLTTFLLQVGLSSGNFVGVLDAPAVAARIGRNPDLGDIAEEDVRATVLAFAALFGFIPASISFALQMIFRQAAVLVLVATAPVTAAGLMSDATSAWFWRALRWMIAAALIKPTLALILVIGINMLSAGTGVAGLIAGAAVLLISVFAPMTLYRLMAFVDPSTGHGQAIRAPSLRTGAEPAKDGGASEATNTARFADATGRRGPPSTGGPHGAATTGGAAAGGGVGAVAGMAVQAARAANGWANNGLTRFAVGHPGSAPAGAGTPRAHGVGSRTTGTPVRGHGGDPPGGPDRGADMGGSAVGAPSRTDRVPVGEADGDGHPETLSAGWDRSAVAPEVPQESGTPQPAVPPSPTEGSAPRPPLPGVVDEMGAHLWRTDRGDRPRRAGEGTAE